MAAANRTERSDLLSSLDSIQMSDLEKQRVRQLALRAESLVSLFLAPVSALRWLKAASAEIPKRQPKQRRA